MRIALACPYSWDAPGGVQVHVRQLGRHLLERGHEVLVLAPGRSRDPEWWVRIVGRPVPVPYNGSVAPICPSPGSARLVRWSLEEFRPDVVHVHEPFAPSTGMFAALRSPAPVAATFHAYAERSALRAAASPLLRLVWRKLDARIAVSRAAASFASRRFGDGFRVVPNGADVDLFMSATAPDRRPGRTMLFVNRLDRRKGFPVAVRAFAILARRLPDLRFTVVGDGRERGAVSRLDPEARARLEMLGTLRHEEVARCHAMADVFVAPSAGRESFGIVLVEAMAAGLPVVASAIPGYDEVVRDGVDGLLVPPSDPRALAEAVERVLTDQGLARGLAESGRERSKRYAWDRVTADLEPIYEELASG